MSGTPAESDGDHSEADASWLHGVEPESGPAKQAREAAKPSTQGDAYELAGAEEPGTVEEESDLPRPPVDVGEPDASAPARAADGRRGREVAVEPVWSRWGEWWPTIFALAAVGILTFALVFATMDLANMVTPLATLLAGGLIALGLSYPIVITLERPVRVTPEQAVRDYFGALCHHIPHYRRMWLLLSNKGRACSDYGSFEGFKSYWKRTLDDLRGGQVSGWTPLVFQVGEFKSEKSAGLSEIDVRFTLTIHARGRRGGAPLATIPMAMSLVRGPDRMWYLDRGSLPRQVERPTPAAT